MTHVDDIGPILNLMASEGLKSGALQVAYNWTYAPLQFIATKFLILGASDWSDILFRLRLPSALFSSMGIALFAVALMAQNRFKITPLIVWAATVPIFSLRSIIEAQQGYNYAAGLFAFSVVGLLLAAPRTKNLRLDIVFRFSLVFISTTILLWTNYQSYLLLPGVLLLGMFEFIRLLKSKEPTRTKMILSTIPIVLALFMLFEAYKIYYFLINPLKLNGLVKAGLYWSGEQVPSFADGIFSYFSKISCAFMVIPMGIALSPADP